MRNIIEAKVGIKTCNSKCNENLILAHFETDPFSRAVKHGHRYNTRDGTNHTILAQAKQDRFGED